MKWKRSKKAQQEMRSGGNGSGGGGGNGGSSSGGSHNNNNNINHKRMGSRKADPSADRRRQELSDGEDETPSAPLTNADDDNSGVAPSADEDDDQDEEVNVDIDDMGPLMTPIHPDQMRATNSGAMYRPYYA